MKSKTILSKPLYSQPKSHLVANNKKNKKTTLLFQFHSNNNNKFYLNIMCKHGFSLFHFIYYMYRRFRARVPFIRFFFNYQNELTRIDSNLVSTKMPKIRHDAFSHSGFWGLCDKICFLLLVKKDGIKGTLILKQRYDIVCLLYRKLDFGMEG
jgi:hypothetical protein